ncbi:MAG: hypothetical protein ACQUHE_03470 [Bacteroidia bacterium]
MKSILLSIVSFALLCLFSCERKDCCTVISSAVEITVLNQQGKNLLAEPAVFAKGDIEKYDVVNGAPQLYNQPHLDADKGFLLIKDVAGKERLRLFLYHNKEEKRSRTLIKFGNTKMDTVDCEFRYSGSSVFLEKVWLNGESKTPQFIIMK